ncbi:putative leader peptide [Streptomyces sp. NPDC052225]
MACRGGGRADRMPTMGPVLLVLVSRRHVDLLRVATALCPTD